MLSDSADVYTLHLSHILAIPFAFHYMYLRKENGRNQCVDKTLFPRNSAILCPACSPQPPASLQYTIIEKNTEAWCILMCGVLGLVYWDSVESFFMIWFSTRTSSSSFTAENRKPNPENTRPKITRKRNAQRGVFFHSNNIDYVSHCQIHKIRAFVCTPT